MGEQGTASGHGGTLRPSSSEKELNSIRETPPGSLLQGASSELVFQQSSLSSPPGSQPRSRKRPHSRSGGESGLDPERYMERPPSGPPAMTRSSAPRGIAGWQREAFTWSRPRNRKTWFDEPTTPVRIFQHPARSNRCYQLRQNVSEVSKCLEFPSGGHIPIQAPLLVRSGWDPETNDGANIPLGKSLSAGSSLGAGHQRPRSPGRHGHPHEPPPIRSTHSAELRQKLAEGLRWRFEEEKRKLWGRPRHLGSGSLGKTHAAGAGEREASPPKGGGGAEAAHEVPFAVQTSQKTQESRLSTSAGEAANTPTPGAEKGPSPEDGRPTRARAETDGARPGRSPRSKPRRSPSKGKRREGSPSGRPNTAPSALGEEEGQEDFPGDEDGDRGQELDQLSLVQRPATTFTSAVRAALSDVRRGKEKFRINDGSAALVKEYWRTPPGPRGGRNDSEEKPDAFTAMKLRDLGVGGDGRDRGLGIGERFGRSFRRSPGPGDYEARPMTQPQPAAKYHDQPSFTMGQLLPLPGEIGKKETLSAHGVAKRRVERQSPAPPLLVMLNAADKGAPGSYGGLGGSASLGSCQLRAASAPRERRPVGGKRQQHGYH